MTEKIVFVFEANKKNNLLEMRDYIINELDNNKDLPSVVYFYSDPMEPKVPLNRVKVKKWLEEVREYGFTAEARYAASAMLAKIESGELDL